jgi:DNA-binding response OmpR family regulator
MIHPEDAAGGPSLLVVDDEPQLALLVERLGQRQGYRVKSARDVPAAWEILQGWRPDLVLLDVNLPGENGLALCRRLRQTAGLASLPVALFGDWQRPDDIVEGLEAGIDFVVAKDLLCRPGDWQTRLQEVLEATRSVPASIALWEQASGCLPLETALGGLQRGLRELTHGQLAPEIVSALLRKAAGQVFDPLQRGSMAENCRAIEIGRLWLPPDSAKLGAFAGLLADCLGRLGGRAFRQPFEQAVAASWAERSPVPGAKR